MAAKKQYSRQMTRQKAKKQNVLQKTVSFFVNIAKRFKLFITNLRAELKRVVWPDRKKLIQSTSTVIAICVIVGLLLFIIDSVLGGILNAIGFYS